MSTSVMFQQLLWGHLGGTKNDFDSFFHLKCAKWNTPGGAGGGDGDTIMQPQAAAQSLVPHAPGVRITRVHKQTPSNDRADEEPLVAQFAQ